VSNGASHGSHTSSLLSFLFIFSVRAFPFSSSRSPSLSLRIDHTPWEMEMDSDAWTARLSITSRRYQSRSGWFYFLYFPLCPSLAVCFPRKCWKLLFSFFFLMMQICTCEGVTRKLTGPSFFARFALRITTSFAVVAMSMRSILWRPRMGYPFFLFAFGFWFVVLSVRVIDKREVLPLWKGTSKVVG